MEGKLTILRTDGGFEIKPLKDPHDPDPIREAVGGPIELVPYFNSFRGEPCVAYCDEYGKVKGKPYNVTANLIWKRQDDVLVGDIAIVQGDRAFMRNL